MSDIFRAIAEEGTALAQDYPYVCLPYQLLHGTYRRRQLYRMRTTDLVRNANMIVFPRIAKDETTDYPSSGGVMTVRGISSGLRGMKHGTQRPTLVLLDDLQTSEVAENPEQVDKLLSLINKDVLNLGGKERLSILQTATPIMPDDLVEKIRGNVNWRTTIYKAIEAWPADMRRGDDSLWKRYFDIYDRESMQQSEHAESLAFYKAHRAEMDAGAIVFNPSRYSEKDGHISALQKLLEIRHMIGHGAFQSEYQMNPVKTSYSLEITPQRVLSKIHPTWRPSLFSLRR